MCQRVVVEKSMNAHFKLTSTVQISFLSQNDGKQAVSVCYSCVRSDSSYVQ